jgi:IS5 family transposase
LRRFAGVDLGRAAAPDETTILCFRCMLEQHELCGKILDTVNLYLDSKGLRIATGSIVDEEQQEGTRSGDASDAERQPVVFRRQGAHRRR